MIDLIRLQERWEGCICIFILFLQLLTGCNVEGLNTKVGAIIRDGASEVGVQPLAPPHFNHRLCLVRLGLYLLR